MSSTNTPNTPVPCSRCRESGHCCACGRAIDPCDGDTEPPWPRTEAELEELLLAMERLGQQ